MCSIHLNLGLCEGFEGEGLCEGLKIGVEGLLHAFFGVKVSVWVEWVDAFEG